MALATSGSDLRPETASTAAICLGTTPELCVQTAERTALFQILIKQSSYKFEAKQFHISDNVVLKLNKAEFRTM